MGIGTGGLVTRVDIAVRGVRMDAPVRRPDGAGPSDDGHVLVGGVNAALPRNPDSPYRMHDGRIFLGELDTGVSLQLVNRPRFYDLTTIDGTVPMCWPRQWCRPASGTPKTSVAGSAR
jgi:hypothetical protein